MKKCLKIGVSLLFASLLQAATSGDLGISLGLDNKVGIGTFLPKAQAQNQLTSTFALAPFIISAPLYDNKSIKLSAEQKFDFEWLSSKAAPAGKISLNDLYIRSSIKNALAWPSLNLGLTPTLETEIPLSSSSIASRRLFGLAANTALSWKYSALSLTYKPALAFYFHDKPHKIHECDKSSPACSFVDRQTSAMLKNTVSALYAQGNHSVNLSLRSYHAFLRGLAPDEYLGAKASDLKISTLGYLEYTYALSLTIPLSLTLGMSSLQPLRDAQGNLNFPFFDFKTPAKNYSQFYCNLEAVFS